MIKNVLFDLDGTLLPFDQDEFSAAYFQHLGAYIAPYMEPKQFLKHLMHSTGVMVANRDRVKSNQEVFWLDFLQKTGLSENDLLPVMESFYQQKFSQLQVVVRPSSFARLAVLAALNSGCRAVVATNPIFPLDAVKQRLTWAGVGDLSFALVTSYEESHFCKPNVDYYLEIADKINCRPEECLMVGNDVEEDLIAGSIGMKTYLVTDCMINAKKLVVKPDYTGTLEQLVKAIPEIIENK